MDDPVSLPPALREFASHSPEETFEYGRTLASVLSDSALVLLQGDLGAGKTALVKGLAEGLGVAREEDVVSPSYTLIHEYEGNGRRLYHIDLYRLEGTTEIATLGLEDLLPGGLREAVVAVEWGGKLPLHPQQRALLITIDITGETSRILRASLL